MRKGNARSTRSERGAALLEFSLVLPVLVALMVGIVSSGTALNRTNSLNNAARESARFGATLPADNLVLWLNQISEVAIDSANGDLDTGAPGRTLCVAYVYPNGPLPSESSIGTDHTISMVVLSSGIKKVNIGESCYADGRPSSERRVQIQVARDVEVNWLFGHATVSIDSQSTSRFERIA